MARAAKPKRFRLSFVGPIEDQPRLIRAYGRACEGEFALVIRPGEGRAVMVLVTPKDGAFVWDSADDGGRERVDATVLRDGTTRLRIESGAHKGAIVAPEPEVPASVSHGTTVQALLSDDGRSAQIRPKVGDCPQRPDTRTREADAVKRVKRAQRAVPKEGPTTLRGRWTGTLTCVNGQPQVELKRKLATYGTLWVRSNPAMGWSWSFERAQQWFTGEQQSSLVGYATLSETIEAGVLGAMALVREACAFRDTRRRAAHDTGYAEKRPIRRPKPMRDPTERLSRPRRTRRTRLAPPPKPVEDGTAPPGVPKTTRALKRAADTAAEQGKALAELPGHRWIWEEAKPPSEIADWFADNGLEGVADRIREVDDDLDRGIEAVMTSLSDALKAEKPASALRKRAEDQLAELRKRLSTAPAVMERARRLIRYATSMVESPKCQGPDQEEATEAVRQAVAKYENARAAILEGQPWDARKTLRRIGGQVALSAAKAARSCAAGQTSLTAKRAKSSSTSESGSKSKRMPKKATESAYNHARRLLTEADTRVGEGHHRVARELLAEAGKQAATLSSSKAKRIYERIAHIEGKLTASLTPEDWAPFKVGDRVTFNGVAGAVTRVPVDNQRPTDKVTFLADGRKRGRRVEARLLVRRDRTQGVDPSMDQALIQAFGRAVSAALSGQQRRG